MKNIFLIILLFSSVDLIYAMDKSVRLTRFPYVYSTEAGLLPAGLAARKALLAGLAAVKVQEWLAVVRAGDLQAITTLLQKGANVTCSDIRGTTALHAAAEAGHCSAVELLLAHGARPNDQEASGNTALHLVVTKLQSHRDAILAMNLKVKKVVERLEHLKQEIESKLGTVRQGSIYIDQRSAQERSLYPVQASADKYNELVDKLKSHQIELVDQEKLAESFYTIGQVLIKKGACINVFNKNGKNAKDICPSAINDLVYVPWWQALTKEELTEADKAICSQYLRIGANPNYQNDEGIPVLHMLVRGHWQKSAELLLQNGAFLAKKERENGFTVLHVAAINKEPSISKALLVCPQGSPAQSLNKHISLLKVQQAMATLEWCLTQSDCLPEMPREVLWRIYSFLLPKTKELIDRVPLSELARYKKFLGKQVLVNALVARHMRIVANALKEKDSMGLCAHQVARNPVRIEILGINRAWALDQPNEVSKLLDPAEGALKKLRPVIVANYTKLLE